MKVEVKNLMRIFLILTTFLSLSTNIFAWETSITVEFEGLGNFGEKRLVNSPFTKDFVRINSNEDSGVYSWQSGDKLQIKFDDTKGVFLVDTKKNISVEIYSPHVDSYFVDMLKESCLSDIPLSAINMANCENTAMSYWDIAVERNYNILLHSLPEKTKHEFVESQYLWHEYRKKLATVTYSRLEELNGMSGRVYPLWEVNASLIMRKNKADELATLIFYFTN